MKARDVFGLILRVVGLFGVLYGGFYFMSSLYMLTGVPERQGFGVQQYLLAGVMYMLVGLYLLRGAPHLLRFAYGPEKPAPRQPDEGADAPPGGSEAP